MVARRGPQGSRNDSHRANTLETFDPSDRLNWAALDHLGGKIDAINFQIEGSVEKSNQGAAERDKIRTNLGSRTEQEASGDHYRLIWRFSDRDEVWERKPKATVSDKQPL